jgi:ComF family protein
VASGNFAIIQAHREYIDSMFRRLIDSLANTVPSQCAVCHTWPAAPVCEPCVVRFAQPVPRCQTCALAVPAGIVCCGACVKSPPPLDACVAAVSYIFPWADLISSYKFRSNPGWSSWFAMLLRSTPWSEPALDKTDFVLPMPLSRQRLQSRGFNQALTLARALDAAKTRGDILLRIKDTPAQSSLNLADRLHSVTDAFAVEPLMAAQLKGKRIVLVDDVMTSGASLYAAAKTLKAAGANHVTGMVIARTE